MRKILLAIGGVITLVVAAGLIGNYRFKQMKSYLMEYTFKKLPLTSLSDGTYRGTCKAFLIKATTEITIKNHHITSVEITDQKCGKGHEANEITSRIIKKQSLDVDAVSGATGSSKCLLIACEKALLKGKNEKRM